VDIRDESLLKRIAIFYSIVSYIPVSSISIKWGVDHIFLAVVGL